MADPRSTVDFTDIDAEYATFIIDNSTIVYSATQVGGSAQVGLAVNLSASKTVQLADDATRVLGTLIKVEADNKATVQISGVMTMKGGTGATLTPGTPVYGDLLSAAKGYIQTCPTTTAAAPLGRGMILDAADTNAVKVLFP